MTVLCGELLREAEFLVNQRIHPMTIMAGWRTAVQIARGALEQVRVAVCLSVLRVCGVLCMMWVICSSLTRESFTKSHN